MEYRDFVTETVRSLFPSANELRAKWASRVNRREVLDALGEHGIDADELGDRTGLPDADPIDVLVHLAWNQPLATRTDRVRRVRKEHADFFDAFQPAAREVLEYLLDKYAEYGITELGKPWCAPGPAVVVTWYSGRVARRFGSPGEWRTAQTRLSELIYVLDTQ